MDETAALDGFSLRLVTMKKTFSANSKKEILALFDEAILIIKKANYNYECLQKHSRLIELSKKIEIIENVAINSHKFNHIIPIPFKSIRRERSQWKEYFDWKIFSLELYFVFVLFIIGSLLFVASRIVRFVPGVEHSEQLEYFLSTSRTFCFVGLGIIVIVLFVINNYNKRKRITARETMKTYCRQLENFVIGINTLNWLEYDVVFSKLSSLDITSSSLETK